VRSNLTEGFPGVPFILDLTFTNALTCQPVVNAAIDIWHADAVGVYSHYEIPGNEGGANTTYLRGTQFTDANGQVRFNTIFPGYYDGRPTHIHVKAHLDGSLTSNVIFTGQMFFTEDLVTAVNQLSPYNTNTVYRVPLYQDAIYIIQSTALSQMDVTYVNPEKGIAGGLIGSLNLGVNVSYTGLADLPNPGAAFGGHPPCKADYYYNLTSTWFAAGLMYSQYSIDFVNGGPCPVVGLEVIFLNPNVKINCFYNFYPTTFTLGSEVMPGYNADLFGQTFSIGQTLSGYGMSFSYPVDLVDFDPQIRIGLVTCGGSCGNPYPVEVFCTTVTFKSVLVLTYYTAFGVETQWNVVLQNTGSSTISFLEFFTLQADQIVSIWGVGNSGGGEFTFPSQTTSLASGKTIQFGYVINSATSLVFTPTAITC